MRTHELGGAVKEGEAQGLNRLEHMEDGAFPRGCPAHRARLDLNVREQVMREDTKCCHALLAAYVMVGTVWKASPLLSWAIVFS